MANLTVDQVRLLDGMCVGAQKAGLGTVLAALQAVTHLYVDVAFVADGAASALTASKNVGILKFTQANATATANLGGSVYVCSLDKTYSRLVGATVVSTGQVPAVDAIQVVGDKPSGGVATVVFTGCQAGDTVTLMCPGLAAAVVLRAQAVPGGVDSDWTVGNGGTTSASGFTEIVNHSAVPACAALIALGNPFTALTIGTCVILTCIYAGATIKSSNATRARVTTDILGTVNVARTMQPGVVLQTAAGVTATEPATGDELKIHLDLQN
jgi:hypothetical protein